MSTIRSHEQIEHVMPVQNRTWMTSTMMVWLGLVAYWILAKFILGLLPGINIKPIASEFSWSTIAVLSILGFGGAWLVGKTGFPQALDANIPNSRRFLYPFLFGAVIGGLEISADLITHATQILVSVLGGSTFNVYFPASLLVYTSGVVMIESFYRLTPIPFLLLVISNGILRGREQEKVFWIIAILLSLLEPLASTLPILFANPAGFQIDWLVRILPVFILTYSLNLGQAYAFRRYGLLACFMVRLSEYMMWHILYGNFIFPAVFH